MIPASMRKLLIVILGLTTLVGQGCTKGIDPAAQQASKRVDLQVWGVVDDADAYEEIFKDFRTLHPYVSINYRRLRLEEYEQELLDALAEDRGPDLFLIHNTWVDKYLSKIEPMPAQTSIAIREIVGTLQKQETYALRTEPTMSLRAYRNDFPDFVSADTIRRIDVSTDPEKRQIEERIVSMPVSVDTLAMFVNKDLLNAAGVATVPVTWTQFQSIIPGLVKVDTEGTLIQYGAGLGTAYNIERSADILTALMMQNGAQMSLPNGEPNFHRIPDSLKDLRDQPPSYQALSFYTDFANPTKEVYSWNSDQPDALEAFVEGRMAFFFGYSYHLPILQARAPKLNLGIAQLPQIDGNPTVNVANYWTWAVSKKTKNKDISWNLLNFMVKPEEMKKYIDFANRPAARKALLPDQLEDENAGVFASQVLTAKTWYRGNDPSAMESALLVLIDNVVRGIEEIPTAIKNAQQKIAQTIKY